MKKIIILVHFYFLCSLSINAQICFDSYNNEYCPYRIVSEFSLTKQLNPFYGKEAKSEFSLNLGIQKGVKKDLSMGIHWFFNFIPNGDKSSFLMGVRPRIAYKLSGDFEASLSPGIIVTNSNDGLEKFKGLSIESNISWKNKLGLVFRVDNHSFMTRKNDTVINLGLQSYGSSSFYSIGGVAIGGIILKLLFGSFVFF